MLPNNNWTSLWIERIILKRKNNFLLSFWTWKYKVNLSRKNFWTSRDRALELLSTNLLSFYFLYFYSHLKCIACSTWTSHCFHYIWTSVTFLCIRQITHNWRTTWTSCNKHFKLFVFYSYILIWNVFRVLVELPAVFSPWTSVTYFCSTSLIRIFELSRAERLNF